MKELLILFALFGQEQGKLPPLPTLTEETFGRFIERARRPVMIKVTASWCGPCKKLHPILHDLQKDFEGRMTVLEVDGDLCPNLIKFLRVESYPTTIIFSHQVERERLVGLKTKKDLAAAIQRVISERQALETAIASSK